ncbi:MAG: SUMF1/EgtB/PvdO family nonheme iron enzyme [Chitinophagaceae bacterium]|nr:SUMF1/EgtB/PvdO family nonheme iron enzyme [Chitinophagaceae bacterium]
MRTLLLTCLASTLVLSSFVPKKKNKVKLPEEFAFIPQGSYYTATPEEDPYYYGRSKTIKPMDSSKIISAGNFYMSKYEVSNLQYRNFFNEVAPGLTGEEVKKIICDSTGWNNRPYSYGEPMVLHYYTHPAFNNYPMVNVSYEGAMKYCEWLQSTIQKDNPDFIIEVKLPEREQWRWAAMGGRAQAMFPWTNYYLRNKKGELMCNFRKIEDWNVYRNRTTGEAEVADRYYAGSVSLSDKVYYTANVKSFYPNDYGLYNMCGNAAEMISEKGICVGGSWNDYGGDVHIRAEATYDRSAVTVGFRPIIIAKEKKQE